MGKFYQRRTAGQLFPMPQEGETVFETPPCFQWLADSKYSDYTVTVKNSSGEVVLNQNTSKNYLVPTRVIPTGSYFYDIEAHLKDSLGSDFRGEMKFEIARDAVEFIRPTVNEVLSAMPSVHPRMQFYKEEVPQILRSKEKQLEVLRHNVILAYQDGMPEEPRYHIDENALPSREFFGRHRDFIDRDLVACSLLYALTGDRKAGKFAIKSLMTICSWNPDGVCSLFSGYGDEVGLSHARVLPTVYDLLFDILDKNQKQIVEYTIAAYARQCFDRINTINFVQNPGNSHVGRIPAYLGEAALVLYKTNAVSDETVKSWLEKALEIYGGIFPYFGTADGGWAEGVFYSTSYTKWYLPFFIAVKRFSGKSFLCRPFYRRVIDWFMHFASPDWENHPFGDGYWCNTDDKEWPGFFAQNPFRVYADLYGSNNALKLCSRCDFPEIYKLHLLDIFNNLSSDMTASQRDEIKDENVRAFPEAGFVSLHTNLIDSAKDTALLARASKFGAVSHEHADQGSFSLIYRNKTLITPSGYYGRGYGSTHHFEWTKTSKAHNVILIDGIGQKPFDFRTVGQVISVSDEGQVKHAVIDMSQAYGNMIKCWIRKFELTENSLTVEDKIICPEVREISWLLHTLSRPFPNGKGFVLTRGNVLMSVMPFEGDLHDMEIRDHFDVDVNKDVPKQFQVDMPRQYHIKWKTPRKKEHFIRVKFEFHPE